MLLAAAVFSITKIGTQSTASAVFTLNIVSANSHVILFFSRTIRSRCTRAELWSP